MNAVQVHLIFNHWPLILIYVGFWVLLWGEWKHNISLQKLGLVLFIVSVIFTILSLMSGDETAQILLELDLAEKAMIEKHAGFAFWSSMLVYAIGFLSFISLIMIHNMHSVFSIIRKFILLLAAGGFILMAITSHTGGYIRHHQELNATITK